MPLVPMENIEEYNPPLFFFSLYRCLLAREYDLTFYFVKKCKKKVVVGFVIEREDRE